MRVSINLFGTTPLLVHNVQLADTDNTFTKEIAAITGKRKKTPEDRVAIADLEWMGGLYISGDECVMPTANITRCLEKGGTLRKLGTAVVRGVIPLAVSVPIESSNGKVVKISTIKKLPEYRDRRPVGVQRSKTVRVRPRYFGSGSWEWRLSCWRMRWTSPIWWQ